jgi:pimeloyl-ACP methyl ester carboxylesterase
MSKLAEQDQTSSYLKRTRYTTFERLPPGCSSELVCLYGSDDVETRGILYEPAGRTRTVVCMSHPRVNVQRHFQIPHFLEAGCAVFAQNSRWLNNDIATTHEHLMLDVAAGMRYLRDERAYEHVVLLGTSGGGSLYAMYQAQASLRPPNRLTHLPSGEPLDLNSEVMPTADGVIFSAAHPGQGKLVQRIIDPSVVDENDPVAVHSGLDMYDPANGFRERPQPSRYSDEFIRAYQEGQRSRVRRLDTLARARIEEQRRYQALVAEIPAASAGSRGTLELRRRAVSAAYMVIYRTTANPAYLDLSIEPSDRIQGGIWSSQPELDNFGEWGLARVLTPRAWLSTWSGISSRASLVDNAVHIDVPCLVMTGTADRDIYPSDSRAIHRALPHQDKELVFLEGADHYLLPSGPKGSGKDTRGLARSTVQSWIRDRFAT